MENDPPGRGKAFRGEAMRHPLYRQIPHIFVRGVLGFLGRSLIRGRVVLRNWRKFGAGEKMWVTFWGKVLRG